MLKKNLKLILTLLLLVGVAVYFLTKQRSSTLDKELTNFAVKDTSSVDKIFIADRSGRKILLEKKKDEQWTLNNKYDARMDKIHHFLSVLSRLKVTAPVGKNMFNNIIKQLSTTGIKVEIYSKGEKMKVFYVGNATQGADGSFMMLENSAAPFSVSMPGFDGYLTPNFDCDEALWRSSNVFNCTYKEIISLKLQSFEHPNESFEFNKNGNSLSDVQLKIQDRPIANFDTVRANHYLMQFAKLNYEAVAELVRETRKDSAMHMPLYKIDITTITGQTQSVMFYKKPVDPGVLDDLGNPTSIDPERMFATLNGNNKELLVAQYFVFGKILVPGSSFLK
jgi:hypothetical protein